MRIDFSRGTLVVDGAGKDAKLAGGFVWDDRTLQWRAPAVAYRELILDCVEKNTRYEDAARAYDRVPLELTIPITPRPHQVEALKSWVDSGRRGVVQLPTGAGKTILALLAIMQTGRPTLIVVPTIDLLQQWQDVLQKHLRSTDGKPLVVGTLGGGTRDLRDVTVATFDSAALMIETIGNRFGLLVVDECHHLPAPQYQMIAVGAIAPFRLGLSATVERADGKEARIFELLGPKVYEARIDQMVATVLAPYDVVSLEVPLSKAEAVAYQAARETYLAFVRRMRIPIAQPGGWQRFVQLASRMPDGREALKAHREQKRLAQASSAKLGELWRILGEHAEDKSIVFTDDNTMAYRIGREFLLPVLTHQTRLKERKQMLERFRNGDVNVLVTSKVLNEGVDVPDAGVGIVISGSGGVREHVQRLGRILRHRPGKRAVLYELVSRGTSERWTNERRKQHHAYQGTPEVSG